MKNIFKIEINDNRIFGLDLLRAFAILGVVASHGNELLPKRISDILTKLMIFDWVGIFFVLSGFLIGGILIREIEQKGFNKETLFYFWKRRWLRTLPAYFFVFAILVIIHILYNPSFDIKSIWKYPFFLQNFASPIPKFFTESWSLSVEEWFYLIFPVSVGLLLKTKKITLKQALLFVSVAIIIFCTTVRLYRYLGYLPNSDILNYQLYLRFQVVTRLDGIAFGVLGALCSHYYQHIFIKHKNMLAVTGILLGLAMIYEGRFYPENVAVYKNSFYWWVIEGIAVSITTLFFLPYLSVWHFKKGWFYWAVTRISLISYSMYLLNLALVHGVIINMLIPWNSFMQNPRLIILSKYGLYWLIVILLSVLLYKFIELPFMKLRDKKVQFGD